MEHTELYLHKTMNEPIFTSIDKQRLFDEMSNQTQQIKATRQDIEKIKLGMFGNEDLKINGLVRDNEEQKEWRRGFKLKMAFFAGIITSIFEAGKWLVEHITNTKQ